MIQVISMGLNITGGDLEFIATIENSDFGASIRKMEADLRSLTQTANTQSKAIEDVAQKAALAISSYLSISTATSFVKDIVTVRGEFQQLEVSFRTMLQSKEKADQLMAEVVQLAATTPFTLQEVGTGAKQLLAYGFAADKVVGTLKMLGNVAAGVSAPIGDIVYLYGTLQTQGRAYTRDIMQFTSRGIPIIGELAKQFGVTKEQVQGLVEAGKVGFPEIEKAFQSITGRGGIFFNLMEEQSKTLTGEISNLKDAFSQMLNSIGKDQQGVLSNVILGATSLVKNYQSVVDALKVLIITYGTYRTALIVNTLATSGMTAAELLHYGALIVAERAQKLLNLTMLTNPYVAAATALAAVVSALVIFGREASNVKSKADLLADAQNKVANGLAETEAKFAPYLEELKKTNLSENERLDIYNKIKVIDPVLVQGLTAKTLSYQTLTANVNKYLDALRNQISIETNKEAVIGSIKSEHAIQSEIDKRIKKIDELTFAQKKAGEQSYIPGVSTGGVGISLKIQEAKAEADNYRKQLEEQKKITQELGKTQVASETVKQSAVKRTVAVIDDEIKAEKELQAQKSTNSKEYQDYQKKINALEEERKTIAGATKAELKAQHTEENKLNSILEKRKSLLNDLSALHQGAVQSGLTKEASEVDKINEKYDQALKKILAFNEENKNKGVKQISTTEINQVGSDRLTEINNANLRHNAEQYKKELNQQKDIFSQYEDAKKQIGVDRANEMFAGQLKGFSSYISYLRAEHDKLVADVQSGGHNIGIDAKLKANSEQIVEAEKNATKVAYEDFAKLLTATQTYSDKKLQIEKQYQKDVALAQKKITGTDLQERLRLLKEGRAAELTDLDNNLARQSNLYENLNRDVIRYTKEQLTKRLDLLKQYLKDGYIIEKDGSKTIITPKMQADLQSGIKQAQEFLSSTNEVFGLSVEHLKGINKYAQLAGTSFSDIADSVRPISAVLADVLVQLSQVANLTASAATAAEGFATGDYTAAISGSVGVLSGLLKIFAQSKTTAEQAKKDIAHFNEAIAAGELDINIAYRERLRIQKDINELKLDGIKKEQELLATEKLQSQNDFDKILAQIRGENFVSGEHSKKKNSLIGGLVGYFTGFGSTTSVEKEYSSLAGKSYDDLNKLFLSGQLEGKARDLFTQLQKLKQEGADIDAAIEQAKADAQQIYTGTTASAITDSIAQGFANGFTSVQQFAGKTEDIVRQAMLNALKYQALEAPIKKIYEQFAIDAQSGGGLDSTEVANFTQSINKTISDAALFAEQIQKATGVSLNNATQSNENSFSSAIKGITAQQADLLAGNIGGLRLTALDQLHVAQSSLKNLQNIYNNTAAAVRVMSDYYRKWDTIGGLKVTVS